MNRLWKHVRSLWPGWGWLTPLPFVLWGGSRFLAGEVRWEYVAVLAAVFLLAFWNARTKKLYVGLYPIALLGLPYDAMRLVQNVGLTEARGGGDSVVVPPQYDWVGSFKDGRAMVAKDDKQGTVKRVFLDRSGSH